MKTVVSFLTLALYATASLSQAQSMFRAGAAHSAVYPGDGPRQFHRVKWVFPTGSRVMSSPVSDGHFIYFGSNDGNIYSVDAQTGRQAWQHPSGGPVASSPSIVNGILYVMSYDGWFYALNARTGVTRWKFLTAGERRFEAKGLHGMQPRNQTMADPFDIYLSSPVVAGGSVYIGSGDNNMYALNAETGELEWKFQTRDVIHASPAYADGVLYFGSWDSYFYALDASNGREKWRFHSGEDSLLHNQVGFQSSPAVVDGVVYTGCRDSNLYAIDAVSGKEKWRFSTGTSWVITSPAVSAGRVIFGTSDTSRYEVVDAGTGKLLLQQQGVSNYFSSPAIAGTVVFQGALNGTLEARDFASGNLLWEFQTDASKRNAGWALTSDRKLNAPMLFGYAWEQDKIASLDREFQIGSIYSSPLIVNGIVYVGSTDGNVYALE